MRRIYLGLILGFLAGIIDLIPMLFQKLTLDANLSALSLWIIAGFLISTNNLKMNSILKGIVISFLVLIPSAFIIGWEQPISLIPITIMTLILGAILGYSIERFGDKNDKIFNQDTGSSQLRLGHSRKRVSLSIFIILFCSLVLMPNLVQAATITANVTETNINSTVLLTGAGFSPSTTYYLIPLLENKTAWWDGYNENWFFSTDKTNNTIYVTTDGGGGFTYNLYIPNDWRVSGGKVSFKVGEQVASSLLWGTQGTNWLATQPTKNGVSGDSNDFIYTASTSAAANQGGVEKFYKSNGSLACKYNWTAAVTANDITNNGSIAFVVTSATSNNLQKINTADCTLNGQQTIPTGAGAATYSVNIAPDNSYIITTHAASSAPGKYLTNGTKNTTFAPTAVASIGYDSCISPDGTTVYIGYASGNVTALNANTGALIWDRSIPKEELGNSGYAFPVYGLSCDNEKVYVARAQVTYNSIINQGFIEAMYATNGSRAWANSKTDTIYDTMDVSNIRCDSSYCYAVKLITPAPYVGVVGSAIVQINKTNGNVTWQNWRSYLPTAYNGAYGSGGVHSSAQTLWIDTNANGYIYPVYTNGWVQKISKNDVNAQTIETNLWIRGQVNFWDYVADVPKNIWLSNETPYYQFRHWNQQGMPLNTSATNLLGTFFRYSMMTTFNSFTAYEYTVASVLGNSIFINPVIQTAPTQRNEVQYFNGAYHTSCPNTRYSPGLYGWHYQDYACLYKEIPATLAGYNIGTTINGTFTTGLVYSLIKTKFWEDYPITKYYGNDKWAWASWYNQTNNQQLGFTTKFGNDQEDVYSDIYGRAVLFTNYGTTYYYRPQFRSDLNRKTDTYILFKPQEGTFNGTTYLWGNVDMETQKIANPINITLSSGESGTFSISGNNYGKRINFTAQEPNLFNRSDEPAEIIFNAVGGIRTDCQDVIITDTSDTPISLWQVDNFTSCSIGNNVSVWIMMNWTTNETKNLRLYYNSSSATPSASGTTDLTVTTASGTCAGGNHEVNVVSSNWYNWTRPAAATSSNEITKFMFNNTVNLWASSTHYQVAQCYKNSNTTGTGIGAAADTCGTAAAPVSRCLQAGGTGKIFAKLNATVAVGAVTNRPSAANTLNVEYYFFANTGRVRIRTQLVDARPTMTTTVSKNWPPYYYFSINSLIPPSGTNSWLYYSGLYEQMKKPVATFNAYQTEANLSSSPLPLMFTFRYGNPNANLSQANGTIFRPATLDGTNDFWNKGCTAHKQWQYYVYSGGTSYGTSAAPLYTSEFVSCDKSLDSQLPKLGESGYVNVIPEMAWYGTSVNRFFDPILTGKMYLMPNLYRPYNRENRFLSPYITSTTPAAVTSTYQTSRISSYIIPVCPTYEYGYKGYDDFLVDLPNLIADTDNHIKENTANIPCATQIRKWTDSRGTDGQEIIFAKNLTVVVGEVNSAGITYPYNLFSSGSYAYSPNGELDLTFAQKGTSTIVTSGYLGKWYFTYTPENYVIHSFSTTGNPQLMTTPATLAPSTSNAVRYSFAPETGYNKHVFDESNFWDDTSQNFTLYRNPCWVGRKNVYGSTTVGHAFATTPATPGWAQLQWGGGTTYAATYVCPFNNNQLEKSLDFRPGWGNSYPVSTDVAGWNEIMVDGMMNFPGSGNPTEAGANTYYSDRHNALYDYNHNDDFNSVFESTSDLNQNEKTPNKQPWYCQISRHTNRSFCVSTSATSTLIYNYNPGGGLTTTVPWSAYWSSIKEVSSFRNYFMRRFFDTSAWAWSYDNLIEISLYPTLSSEEVLYSNILYTSNDANDYASFFQKQFPTAADSLDQTQFLLKDWKNSAFIVFSQDTRHYAAGLPMSLSGLAISNGDILNNSNITLGIYSESDVLVQEIQTQTNSSGMFNWTLTLPTSMSAGLYYVKFNYNNTIIDAAEFRTIGLIATITSDQAAYEQGQEVQTTVTITNSYTSANTDPDQLELRYLNPSSSVVECAKYPNESIVSGCDNNLTKTTTGVFAYTFSIGGNPLGVYTQRATVTEDGIAANFDRGFVVALIDPCKPNSAFDYALSYPMQYDNVTDVLTIIGNSSMGASSSPITTEQMYEFAQATRGTCIIEKPATGTYTIKSQLVIGNGTNEVYVSSKGESVGFTTENMPQLFINKSAHINFGGIANGIPQEGSSVKFTSNQTNDILLDVAGGELAFYDSYVGDVGNYLGRFIYRGGCGVLVEETSDVNSSITIKKTIFDRAARGQFFFTGNVTIDDMKVNRINSSSISGYGIVSGCSLPALNNLQIYHQEQQGAGIFVMNNTPANTDLVVTSSTLDYNNKDVIANKEGRGVQLVNTQWDRSYGFNYSGDWEGTTTIKESYGYLPSIVDTSSGAIVNTSIVLIDRYGNVKLNTLTDSLGTIAEQNIPTWQVEKSTSESVSDFNPFNLKIKKYGKTFVSEPKTFSVRTVETKQLTDNPFTNLLSENEAKALTGIIYSPPVKVSYADEEDELVGADDYITLNNTPITQSEFFGLYNDTGSTIPSSDYSVDYATGVVTFDDGYEAITVRAVYSYGGSIQIVGNKTISQIYHYLQANLSDVFTTQTGSIYDSYVHIILGNETDSGTIRESSELTLNFKEGYGFSSENENSATINLQSDTWNFTWIGNTNETFSRKYALDLLVTYSNGTAMEGANVTITTINSDIIFNELTNASGNIPHQEISYATYNDTSESNATLLSPHTIEITKTRYITSSASVTIDSIQDLTYALYEESNPCDPDNDYAYALVYPMEYNATTDTLTIIGNSSMGTSSNPITFNQMYEFATGTKGSCIMQKPATGTYAVLSQLIVGNGTQEVYVESKGESIGFSSDNMPELTIRNNAHLIFGGISDGIPQEGCSVKFASNASNDLLLDVAGGELAFYDSYITDAGTSWGRFLFRGGCGNATEGTYADSNSSITIKKTIFDRATRGQFFYTSNVTIDDMKVNRINSSANDGFGLVAGCNMPALNNLQIYHQEQTGGGIRTLENMPADTLLTITGSTLDYNNKDVIANKEGRGVQLINTQWDRSYGFNWTESWEGTTTIKESYGYNPTFVDTSSSSIANLTMVLINQYGEVEISQETGSSGGIGEQYIPTWQVEKSVSGESESSFNPYTLYAKKYTKTFISEPKSFASRTLETKQVSANSFTILSEVVASAVKNITYNAPTKVSYGDEANSSWTTSGQLSHYPIDQCQYFALFANGTKLALTSNYTIDYETGEITFVQNMAGMEIKPVYFYGGDITITNGFTLTGAYSMSKIYDYMSYVTSKNNLSEDLITIDGINYQFCVNFVIGNDTHRGSVSDSSATISFKDGYDMSFSGLGGYVDLAGITSGGGSSGGLPLNIFDSVGSSYAPGNTVYVFSTVLNSNGQLVDANVDLSIYLPNGTLYNSSSMTATSTGRLDYNFVLPGDAQLGTWRINIDASYGTAEVHDNVAFLVSTSAGGGGGGGTTPSIQIDAPSIINTNENFGVYAFTRNNNSLLVNCDSGASLTLKDTANGTNILSGVAMTNSGTGRYNYTTSLSYQSTFLVEVTCAIGGTTYVSNPKIISSQNVPTNDTGGTGGSAYPTIELLASTPIKTSTTASIGALVKSSNGIISDCDGSLAITIRNLADGTSSSGEMTNFGTGMYNYSWTTPSTASVFYVNASCLISGTSYTGFTMLSTQDVGATATIDYNQIALYVWNYTSRNLTWYNQSVSESIQSCLKDGACSGWWINTTFANIQNTINIINSTANQIKTNTETILSYLNCTSANEICTRLQNILNNATDIQSRVYSLNTSQIPNLQTGIDSVYTDTQYIRTNMATASALADVNSSIWWIRNNMVTQAMFESNMTDIKNRLNEINTTTQEISTIVDCSNPANSDLCTYLNNMNSTIDTIYSEMATYSQVSGLQSNVTWIRENMVTQEMFNANMSEIRSRLTEMNTTIENTYDYLSTTITNNLNYINQTTLIIREEANANNLSIQSKLDILRDNVTWLIENVATSSAMNANFSSIINRLNEINSTTQEINNIINCSNPTNSEICSYLNNINTTTNSIYSEMATQALLQQVALNVSYIRDNMATYSQVADIGLNISWIKENVATQEQINSNFSDVIGRLTNINTTLLNVHDDLSNVNISLANQISNVQNNITWLIGNVATQEQINNNFTEVFTRLNGINTTITDTNNYLYGAITSSLSEINSTNKDITDYLYNQITDSLNQINNTTQESYSYLINNLSIATNLTEVLAKLDGLSENLTYVKNNMFYQGNATGAFLVDYLATVYAEKNSRAELWILTRDLLGNSKTVSSATCSIVQKGIYIANATVSIYSGSVYAYWDIPTNQTNGEYSWNCTLTGSTLNLYVPFFVSSETSKFEITSLISASPKYPNENAIVEATFASQNGSVEPDSINLTIWKPNYLTIWHSADKNAFSFRDGIWYWTETIEASPTTGTYYVNMRATYNGYEDSRTTQFRIATGGPYKVYLECPTTSNIGSNLICTVIINDEGEAETESTTTIWVDTNNNGILDAGEPQTSFSKETQPMQNITETATINVPSSHATGSFVVRASTEYLNSGQPNSAASDSVTLQTSSSGGDTGGGTGGGSSGGGGGITGQTIIRPENLMDVLVRVLDDYKVVVPGSRINAEITFLNLGTEEIKDAVFTYCIYNNNNNNVGECIKETVAVQTKVQLVRRVILPTKLEDGIYYFDVKVNYMNETVESRDTFEVKKKDESTMAQKPEVFSFKINKSYLIIGILSLASLIILIFIAIIIIKKRNKHHKISGIEYKLHHLKELKSRGEISEKTYHAERERLLQRISGILKGKTMSVILLGIGLISLLGIFNMGGGITGYVIGESVQNNLATKYIYFVLLIGALGLLIFIHNKKIKQGVEKINEKIKKKYPANSIKGLIGKKVYSESGDYIGKIKDIILGENKIDSLKIKLDKKLDAKAKGIVINWKQIVSCGEILIIDSRILSTI